MSQLVFKFPFKTKYYEQDYYVSSNNFAAYRLIESWPNWPDKWVNIFGPKGSGKTHLAVAIAGERLRRGSQVIQVLAYGSRRGRQGQRRGHQS